ncbi:hepatic leukemia factor-like isoform X1 [Mercenaria mercenaria]|uniref:hepatic leukemia factor-like isoform X1 n=1 Tax=Mercenaria mercenaria TaxID=6596 RepID=UPI00234F88F5|nr:hepatic leukemia factor-like isoform X1 [Mercenaria mercenaria]
MSNFGYAGHGFSLKALLEDPNLQTAPTINNGVGNVKKQGKTGSYMPIGNQNASSAFLGSNLWDKPGGDDGSAFDLEYMDLDEFLSENGIPVNLEENDEAETISLLASALAKTPPQSPQHESTPLCITPESPVRDICITEKVKETSSLGGYLPDSPVNRQSMSPLSLSPVASPRGKEPQSAIERYLMDDNFGVKLPPKVTVVTLDEAIGGKRSLSPVKRKSSCLAYEDTQMASIPVYMQNKHSIHPSEYASQSMDVWEASDISSHSSNAGDDYDVDIVSSVPGQENFDPTSRKFSEEELKPQPIIKKSKKIFVDEHSKDDRYWQRRKKNNIAAKRSRDARRVKENQIAMRASFLEQQHDNLSEELEKVKRENEELRKRLSKYEKV